MQGFFFAETRSKLEQAQDAILDELIKRTDGSAAK